MQTKQIQPKTVHRFHIHHHQSTHMKNTHKLPPKRFNPVREKMKKKTKKKQERPTDEAPVEGAGDRHGRREMVVAAASWEGRRREKRRQTWDLWKKRRCRFYSFFLDGLRRRSVAPLPPTFPRDSTWAPPLPIIWCGPTKEDYFLPFDYLELTHINP